MGILMTHNNSAATAGQPRERSDSVIYKLCTIGESPYTRHQHRRTILNKSVAHAHEGLVAPHASTIFGAHIAFPMIVVP
jgi:hypothetical protein